MPLLGPLLGIRLLEQKCLKSVTECNVPRTRTKFGDRAFSVAGPTVWNSLPESVRSAETLASFKRKLKTYLFSTVSRLTGFYHLLTL